MLMSLQVTVKVISLNLAELFISTATNNMELKLCKERFKKLYKTVSMPVCSLLLTIASITKQLANDIFC